MTFTSNFKQVVYINKRDLLKRQITIKIYIRHSNVSFFKSAFLMKKQTNYSRALAPACGALVLKCNIVYRVLKGAFVRASRLAYYCNPFLAMWTSIGKQHFLIFPHCFLPLERYYDCSSCNWSSADASIWLSSKFCRLVKSP